MNYILSATRKIDDFTQSVIVKIKGGTGALFPTMRTYALLLTEFDLSGQTGSDFKSMNYVTKPTDINNTISGTNIDVKCVINFNEPNAINNDKPRNTIVVVKGITSYGTIVSSIKTAFQNVTGQAYTDTKLYVRSLSININK